ncbi:MAG: hypothetical protein GXX10_11340 [Clostridiaceae bacterium]|nr:hypothetical protein [Clostridiaceae bacterium]
MLKVKKILAFFFIIALMITNSFGISAYKQADKPGRLEFYRLDELQDHPDILKYLKDNGLDEVQSFIEDTIKEYDELSKSKEQDNTVDEKVLEEIANKYNLQKSEQQNNYYLDGIVIIEKREATENYCSK